MKVKVLAIITAIVLVLMSATAGLLAIMKENCALRIVKPATINIYKKSLTPFSYSINDGSKEYNDLYNLYNNMTKISYFKLLTNNQKLGQKLTQDEKADSLVWKEINLINFYCIEFVFDKQQSVILDINGSTKRIDYYSLIFKIDDSNHIQTLPIYFSTTDTKIYTQGVKSYPFLIRCNTNNLYNYISKLGKN